MPSRTIRHPLQVTAAGVVGAAAAVLLAGCGTVAGSGGGSAGAGEWPGPSVTTITVPTTELADALGCPHGTDVAVAQRVALPTSQPSVVLVAHCQSAAGSPPDGVFQVTGAGTRTRLAATLVRAKDQVDVSSLVRSGDQLRMTGRGYSSTDVPRCCPDVPVAKSWRLVDDQLVASS